MDDFNSTYKEFSHNLNYYSNNMSFKTWNKKREDLKAAYLFVNFYSAVSSAWYKARFSFVRECDAVSIVLQYLQKNVKKIEQDKKRYDVRYIYTVCYNCIKDLRWIKKEEDKFNFETSLTVTTSDGEVDLSDMYRYAEFDSLSVEFEYGVGDLFSVIYHMGPKYEKIAYSLISDMGLRKVRSSMPNRERNPLCDVSVRKCEYESILNDLKEVITVYVNRYRPDLVEFLQ